MQKRPAPESVADIVRLSHLVESGQMDCLECPQCHKPQVTVRFSHPAKNEYRTWLICQACSYQTRMQESARPRFFSEDRVDMVLEAKDVAILKQLQLPRGEDASER
jgi:hypothetical protein